jgi:hypothetical protein
LNFQSFNGSFGTGAGLCSGCTFDLANGTCQVEVEKVFGMFQSYRKDLQRLGRNLESEEEDKQYKQYCETLKNALMTCKDEIRRSFKDNGFHELSGIEYSSYIKDKTGTLISIAKSYMVDRFPHENMAVSLDHCLKNLDTRMIEDITFEVFNRAKAIRMEAEENVAKIDVDFKEDLDKYVEEQCS